MTDKAPDQVKRRGFWPMRDIPTVVWLLLTVVSTIVHRWVPSPTWLMIHLLLLGAVTHAILVWSQYFSFALLRSAATTADRRRQSIRLILANGGAAIIVTGVLTTIWPITLIGVAALITAVVWHGLSLYRRYRRSMPGRFGRTIRYYIVSAAMLTIGALLGAWLARGDSVPNLVLAHALTNVLGWIGITVAGTVVTLWPTILRTRADEHAALGAARALPVLAGGVLVAALSAAFGLLLGVALGLLAYLVGLAIIGVSLFRAARNKPPRTFAALSVGAGLVWLLGAVATVAIGAIVFAITGAGTATETAGAAGIIGPDPAGFADLDALFAEVVPFLVAGFAAQVLLGALSYLVPVVLGGGPTPVRIGTAGFDAGGLFRVTVANAALVVYALPVSSLLRVVSSMMYLIAMASFLVIMFRAMRAQRRAKAEQPGERRSSRVHGASEPGNPPPTAANGYRAANPNAAGQTLTEKRRGPITPEGEQPRGRRAGQAVAGLLAVVLVSAGVAAADPIGMGWGAAPTGDADAPVQTVQVEAADMRFTPNRIEVPVGTRLVIEITNTDPVQVHDLVFANGAGGGRLSPGESETIDVGVITADLDGWCSILGHKQMGMTMQIVATGGTADAPGKGSDAGDHDMADMPGHEMPGMNDGGTTARPPIDLMADPGPDFEAYDAALPPLPASDAPVTRELTLRVSDEQIEVAPGVTQTLWTYNKTAPGPTLHGKVGDKFVITLVNDGSMGHSIDFHAGALAPDRPMRTIAPGESLTYTFTATRSGIWMYHCSTMPMTAHIANGMYGAVVIEPDDLPAVDRSYVLVQGEYYLGDHDGGSVDMDRIATRNPDLVTFNGYANQYDHAPLPASVGERVRVWVLDAGIERASSFHVIGGQFDTVWTEGAYTINRATDTGAQVLPLAVAQGGFVELTFPEPGTYPFVSHYMIDAERGAHGLFAVD
ncbi:multicopper oxidase domain-containing protein [Microbacterium sp. H1-D42]|uniref:multicopper oxidase domain-containing protein n=1 Tax=Microbacterium sp. H1-D42 TaxID=2925844 RepID=UPI001F53041F|nr:multicopper oxidase domain-containing protein [Microbacterium sp. H1-D42]UNK70171.1 multicopper oxidase domain-containing protein [Microbacterium sp. H1-D42]